MQSKRKSRFKKYVLTLLFVMICVSCRKEIIASLPTSITNIFVQNDERIVDLHQYLYYDGLPEYKTTGKAADKLTNGPFFTDEEIKNAKPFKVFSNLDLLGRCGQAYACLTKDSMPTEERGPIGNVKPSGWHTVKYNDVVEGNYLYNRCHLLAYCLTGENANEKNLITGTRFMNTEGMLPYETKVAKYLDKHPENHVLYRVTPVYKSSNLVAKHVIMEAYSIEDKGKLSFCVVVHNVQPGVIINYKDGTSRLDEDNAPKMTKKKKDSSKKKD